MTTTGRTPDQHQQPQTPTEHRPDGDRSASGVARIQGAQMITVTSPADPAEVARLRSRLTRPPAVLDEVTFVELDLTAFNDAIARAAAAVERFLETCRRARLGLPEPPPADPKARALWLRQHRNTGPKTTHHTRRSRW